MAICSVACSDNFGEALATHLRVAGQHSAWPSVDNCHRDQAVTNAARLADLLRAADLPVARPDG